MAGFIDRQHQKDGQALLTYSEGGERHPMSFLLPRTPEDVRRRGAAYYEWARWSNGMFGRTPDYKNASVMAFAGAAEFLNEGRGRQRPRLRRQHAQLL